MTQRTLSLERDMKRLVVIVIGLLAVTHAFAQASAPTADATTPASSPNAKEHEAQNHEGGPFIQDKSKLDGGDRLQ
ncbi:hypothetical protein [Burkholderia pseudomallei]|uniref:hypothetical protein n=1 Tax=Burkholderia pseudomallei TaxID=28450 RepID=UPI0010FACA55|nr:hypothetical protein [Burkholderia pseudomallei]